MSEDIKQSEETQEIEETAATSQEESSELDENQSKNEEEESTDVAEPQDEYKKALEEERAKRLRAEKKIVDLKKSKSSDVDTDALIEAARTAVRQEIEASKAEEIGSTTEEFISALSTNPNEQELIRFHYDNTIKRSGATKQAIYQDLTRAKLLANESKLVKQNSELKNALMSRNKVTSPQFSGQPVREERNPLNAADKALLKGMGLKEADIIKKLKK